MNHPAAGSRTLLLDPNKGRYFATLNLHRSSISSHSRLTSLWRRRLSMEHRPDQIIDCWPVETSGYRPPVITAVEALGPIRRGSSRNSESTSPCAAWGCEALPVLACVSCSPSRGGQQRYPSRIERSPKPAPVSAPASISTSRLRSGDHLAQNVGVRAFSTSMRRSIICWAIGGSSVALNRKPTLPDNRQ